MGITPSNFHPGTPQAFASVFPMGCMKIADNATWFVAAVAHTALSVGDKLTLAHKGSPSPTSICVLQTDVDQTASCRLKFVGYDCFGQPQEEILDCAVNPALANKRYQTHGCWSFVASVEVLAVAGAAGDTISLGVVGQHSVANGDDWLRLQLPWRGVNADDILLERETGFLTFSVKNLTEGTNYEQAEGVHIFDASSSVGLKFWPTYLGPLYTSK